MVYHFLLGKLQPPPTITTRPIYKWYSTAHVYEIPKFEFQPLLVRPIFSADEMVFLVDIWLVVSERKPKWNPGNVLRRKNAPFLRKTLFMRFALPPKVAADKEKRKLRQPFGEWERDFCFLCKMWPMHHSNWHLWRYNRFLLIPTSDAPHKFNRFAILSMLFPVFFDIGENGQSDRRPGWRCYMIT